LNRLLTRALLASAAAFAAIALAACDPDSISPTANSLTPISERTLAEMQAKQMDKNSPILIRIFKEESEMEVWKKNRLGEFALLKTYPICRWSGDLGPKVKEGDRQAPEGFYPIGPGQMNPNSNYYLAFNTGYPNTFDRAWNRTGSELMVHGDCSSRGCYAMTDEQMQEIYSLARDAFFGGQKSFQLEAFPFRMTALNMAKHRNNPNFAFWKMLKEGYDHFEATHQEPKVAVCEKRYVFDAVAQGHASRPLSFNPRGACPAYQLNPVIATAVLDHRREEQFRMAQYIAQDVPVVPIRSGVDGGMNPVFESQLTTQEAYDSNGRLIRVAAAPGALPRKNRKLVLANNNTVVLPQTAPSPQPAPSAQAATTSEQPASDRPNMVLVSLPQPAPEAKEGVASQPPQDSSKGGLFGGLFGSSEAQAAPAAASSTPPLRGTDTETPRNTGSVRTASAPMALHPKLREPARPKKSNAVAHAAPAPAPVRQASTDQKKAAPAPAPAAPAEMRSAYSAPPPPSSNNVMAGAQPVVQVNSFENRWAAIR
jgi:murein L,D-transpeptidase YafK